MGVYVDTMADHACRCPWNDSGTCVPHIWDGGLSCGGHAHVEQAAAMETERPGPLTQEPTNNIGEVLTWGDYSERLLERYVGVLIELLRGQGWRPHADLMDRIERLLGVDA